jgi:hypothetical protein
LSPLWISRGAAKYYRRYLPESWPETMEKKAMTSHRTKTGTPIALA